MNNIHSFKDFKKINEATLIGQAFKNLMKKILVRIDKSLADNVTKFIKQIEGKNEIKDVVPYVNTFIETTNNFMENSLKKAGDVTTVRKIVADTCLSIFDTMQALAGQFKNNENRRSFGDFLLQRYLYRANIALTHQCIMYAYQKQADDSKKLAEK